MKSVVDLSGRSLAPLIIFIHIPKTAGITLVKVLERQFGVESIFQFREGASFGRSLLEYQTMSYFKRNRIRVARGHVAYGLHDLLGRPGKYMTLLREPVERMISYYYYVRRKPDSEEYDLARRLSLEEFITKSNWTTADNGQTRQLSGEPGAFVMDHFVKTSQSWLERAKRNIEQKFSLVGLTEEFDLTLLLLKRQLGLRDVYYYTANVSTGRPHKEDLSPSALRLIQDYNELDCDLYKFALELFHTRIVSQQPLLQVELDMFRKRNQQYGKYYAYLADVWKKVRKTLIVAQ